MKQLLRLPVLDRFLGRGSAAVTVPPLDGGLKPNNRLEDLPQGISGEAPDDIALWQGAPVWTDGARIMSEAGEQLKLDSTATALAANGRLLAVATAEQGLRLFDSTLKDVTPKFSAPVRCVTALAFAPDETLWFATGSANNSAADWRRDLMEMNRSGSLGRVGVTDGKVEVTRTGLGWPAGIAIRRSGAIVVAEAWASHLVEFDKNGRGTGQVLLDEIPGYPGRLARRAAGGWWLCIFAPRSPLLEFVLREPAYRKAMLAQIDPAYWVAPNYSSGGNFREPMQGGALKQMGILKPWAPTLSYGLIVALDHNFVPVESLHSRAGGRRHGITGALETGGRLWLASHGGQEVLTAKVECEGRGA